MDLICDDLDAEYRDLRAIVDGLPEAEWLTETPSPGWTVKDQIAHLAYFDERALAAHEDPEAFAASVAEVMSQGGGERLLEEGRSRSGREILARWDHAHRAMVDVYRRLDPKTKVLWYGPQMAARSKMTARLMETWAHGQDVADALGVERQPTDRLRHVCHIGVRARPFAYLANGKVAPPDPVYVELAGPDGDLWTWGEPDGADRVTGSGLDFALVVTQRRHRKDTDLIATGQAADEWLSIAQAFAGPPGEGRKPGQFD